MQCHDGEKSDRRDGMGGTGCQRPTVLVLGTTDLRPLLVRPSPGGKLVLLGIWASKSRRFPLEEMKVPIIMPVLLTSYMARSVAIRPVRRGDLLQFSLLNRLTGQCWLSNHSSPVAFASRGTKEDSMQRTINEVYSRRVFFNSELSSRCIEHCTASGCHSNHGKRHKLRRCLSLL